MKYKLKENVTEEQLLECGFEKYKFINAEWFEKSINSLVNLCIFTRGGDEHNLILINDLYPNHSSLKEITDDYIEDLIKEGYVEVVE